MFTNVSSDHLDLQGIHTLPELAEVKATVCRVTRADGLVVLNADDPLRGRGRAAGAGAGRVLLDRARAVAGRGAPPALGRARMGARAGRARGARGRRCPRPAAGRRGPDHARRARAAQRRERPGGDRRGAGDGRVHRRRGRRAPGLPAVGGPVARAAQPVSGSAPWTVVVDFAHNEAGTTAILDVACGLAERAGADAGAVDGDHRHRRRPAGRHAPGDRADHGVEGGPRGDQGDARVPARPRPRDEVVQADPRRASAEGGVEPPRVPVYASETAALGGGARRRRRASRPGSRPTRPRVVVAVLPRGARRGVRPARAPGAAVAHPTIARGG